MRKEEGKELFFFRVAAKKIVPWLRFSLSWAPLFLRDLE